MKLTETGWEIEGSSGGSVRLGTPLARVEMGRGNIVLPSDIHTLAKLSA